jgi:3-deoxy-D-manno-octulosonic-acid transferase
VLATRARGIPMMLLNARLSAGSYRRWRCWPGLIGPMLGAFDGILAQDERQAERLRRLGGRRVTAIGDLKAAGRKLPADPREVRQFRSALGGRPTWLAASTHPGEEEIVAGAHRLIAAAHQGLLTIIVPRHPARGDAIATMLAADGWRVARRSRGEPVGAETDIYLADTIGELGLFYRLAGIAFIGGSLAAKGGHNPFEAARLGCVVLHGPDMSNCATMTAALTAAGAAQLAATGEDLAEAVSRLLADRRRCAAQRAAAARVAAAGRAVLDAVVERLAPWLDAIAPQPGVPVFAAQAHSPTPAGLVLRT